MSPMANFKKDNSYRQDKIRREIRAAQNGDERALDAFVREHDGLIGKVAQQYFRVSQLEDDDIMQAGRMGLVEAVQKFDLKTDNTFATFAYHRIRYRVQECVAKSYNMSREAVYIMVISRELEMNFYQEKERLPTRKELFELVYEKITTNRIRQNPGFVRVIGLHSFQYPRSLDAEMLNEEGDGGTLHSLVEDTNATDPEGQLLLLDAEDRMNTFVETMLLCMPDPDAPPPVKPENATKEEGAAFANAMSAWGTQSSYRPILNLLLHGKTQRDISKELGIGERAVGGRVKHIWELLREQIGSDDLDEVLS